MTNISKYSGWYKFALLCIGLGFVSMGVAFGLPSWVEYDVFGTKYKAGLWQVCTTSLETCSVYDIGEQLAWFEFCRGILALSIALYIATICVAIKQTCVSTETQALQGRTTSILSFTTGAVGLTGTIIYGAMIDLGVYGNFSVSYWLALLGSGGAFAGGAFISVNRRSFRGTIIRQAPIRQVGFNPPPRYHPPGMAQPTSIGGPIMPGYPPRSPNGTSMSHGLAPGYPPTGGFVYNQGYLGPPPAYSSLPGQIEGVGAWPGDNTQPPPPPVYNEPEIKR